MSEDRHTFSEPRPIAGLTLPSWDVDVFRDGVPEPILTLRVDETNLPPRRSKKKKIVWRLPETVDQSPRFGDYEKRRLLDIFKSLKKERRKSKRGSETGGGGSIGGSDTVDVDDSKDFGTSMAASSRENDPPEGAKQNGSSTANGNNIIITNNDNINNNIGSQPKPQNGSTHYHTKDSDSIAANGTTTAAPANPTTMGMERLSVEQSTPSSVPPAPPPGMIHMARSQSVPEARSGIPMPPPGLAPQPPLPPPIQQQQQPPPMPAPGFEKSPVPAATSSPPMNPSLLPTPSQRPTPSRFFNIPPNMPHEMFAQQVANLYISLLQTGQIEELFLYYATTAQKSLSLKSAKSICATPLEMKTQLQSLVGCAFVVQGITVQVQQPAQQPLQQQQQQQQSPYPNQNNDYMLLIWSGICQVQGQQHGFCHTLILAPLAAEAAAATHNGNANGGAGVLPRGYQIQNDALVLLANE